jgi:hypothetical protein
VRRRACFSPAIMIKTRSVIFQARRTVPSPVSTSSPVG